jgi:aldehyde dehydrogenase (NAD+)
VTSWHEERLLIDGHMVPAEHGATYETIAPATEAVLGTAADASLGDAERAIAAARRAFDTTEWSRDHALRVRCLRQLHQALLDNAADLREILVHEVGAPVQITHGAQLDGPTEVVRWYAELLEGYEFVEDLGERESFGRQNRRWIEKEAAGVVGAIAAYNYPIQLALAKLAPALAAGCTVVLKGAPDTPWATLALGKLIAEATDIPPGVVNVLAASGNAVGALLTTHPDVDVVSFTGSTPVGRQIMAAASATVKRVFLELGGKSAFLVLDDADLAGACSMSAFTAAMHAGQGCAITTRLVVPRARYDEAVEAAAATMGSLKPGDPTDSATICGPVISARQRDRVQSYLDSAIDEGGKFACGGGRPADRDTGFFIEPTVIIGLDNNAKVAREEIFGPVLTVIAHDGDDDAVRIANDSPYGLSGTVFSSDPERAGGVAARMRVGTVNVNGGVWYSADMPFGGYKQSGIGREMGLAGFEEYLETKAIATAVN